MAVAWPELTPGAVGLVAWGAATACSRHPGARAGWQCDGCGEPLCPGCAYRHRVGATEIVACTRCGAMARPILVHRRDRGALVARLLPAFGYPFSTSGLFGLAALGLMLWLLAQLDVVGAILSVGVAFTTLFSVIRSSGDGDDDFQPYDFTNFTTDLLLPTLRGLAATAPLLVVASLYLAYRAAGAREPLAFIFESWELMLLYVAGWLYVPAALLVAACGGGLSQVMAPDHVLRTAYRLGQDYVVVAACVTGVLLAQVGAVLVARLVASSDVPVLSLWAALVIGAYLPVVAARMLGILLYLRGDDIGHGATEDYLEPVLADAMPQGCRRPAAGDG